MEALQAIRSRASVREYLDKPIPKDVIESIVDCGRLAPTARKEEPWEFIVVIKRDRIASLAEATDHGKFMKAAACVIAVFCKDTKYYLEDGCAATENMLVAAAACGVGGCWVAGDKKWYAGDIARILGVPQGYKLVSLLSLGYPKLSVVPVERRGLASVLRWEKWD